jgi:hypothetical protein
MNKFHKTCLITINQRLDDTTEYINIINIFQLNKTSENIKGDRPYKVNIYRFPYSKYIVSKELNNIYKIDSSKYVNITHLTTYLLNIIRDIKYLSISITIKFNIGNTNKSLFDIVIIPKKNNTKKIDKIISKLKKFFNTDDKKKNQLKIMM